MLEIYRIADASHGPTKIDTIESGSWIRMIRPTEDEIAYVCTTLSIPRDDIITLLDDEESPRIEHDEGRTFIIVDTPYVDTDEPFDPAASCPAKMSRKNHRYHGLHHRPVRLHRHAGRHHHRFPSEKSGSPDLHRRKSKKKTSPP